jgi:hypothetical protein
VSEKEFRAMKTMLAATLVMLVLCLVGGLVHVIHDGYMFSQLRKELAR